MAVKIKLKRMGRTRAPHYRIVVADARAKRDGRSIEEIGKYHPKQDPSGIELDSDRAQYWLGVGAQPTEAVAALLRVTGDWQRYKGLPGAEGTLKTPEARTDKKAVFADAARAAMAEESTGGATSSKGNSAGPTAVGGKPEAKSTEAKSTEAKSTEAKSTEAKSTEAKSTEAKSTEAKSTEAKPADEASPAPGEQAAGAGADSGDPSGGASGDAGPGA